MTEFNPVDLQKLYVPPSASHKGMNGKLLIIGGSKLFHAASLWALEIASRVVDMVYYASVPENNQIVHEAKSTFKNGIVIPREEIEGYIEEADCVLMGSGMVRRSQISNENSKSKIQNIKQIDEIEDEGVQTRLLTEYLLKKYPRKRWVLDAGSLQEMEPTWIPEDAILTPHAREFERLFAKSLNDKIQTCLPARQVTNQIQDPKLKTEKKLKMVFEMAKAHNCVILLKGVEDSICSSSECRVVAGGNSGMTKGGTGDVLAGLAAALYCKNNAFLAACSASFFNKKAADALFAKQGYYFNSSDLVAILPLVMKQHAV